MKIAFVLIGSLSLVARVFSNQLTIQNGIDEVNKYILGQTSDLSGILFYLRNNALINHNDHNVFTGPLNNHPKDVAHAVLKHLQIDQAIQDLKPYRTDNNVDVNALTNLLDKDLFKRVLPNNQDIQALKNSLNNQLAPPTVVGVILRHLQIEQAIQLLKYYEIGNSGVQNTLTNILNNDLLNEGLISHQDYDNFKGQLKHGKAPNTVASEAVGFLYKGNNVQINLHNLHIDQAVQDLENYQEENSGSVNALFQILDNLVNEGLFTSQEHGGFKDQLNAPPINGDPDKLSSEVIKVLNNKKRAVSD